MASVGIRQSGARHCPGSDLSRVAALADLFSSEKASIQGRGSDWVGKAIGHLCFYPQFLEFVGHGWRTDDVRRTAYFELGALNVAAADALMVEAERAGMDSGPIWEFARVCREIFHEEPWEYYHHDSDLWPDCLGRARANLPPDYREAIRDGEMALRRLGAKLDLTTQTKATEAGPTTATPRRPLKAPHEKAMFAWRAYRCVGLNQVEIVAQIKQRFGETVTQGAVSKWINEGDRFLAAGGLPQDVSRAAPITTLDPSKIEIGPRGDRLTKRQRGRSSDEE